ncbi:peptide chain release factor N(5)-glutamine methyltransferase [Solirubrobacter ginsenosidimutans]|uniref:Peptide chain release factor N(5)-glutamine methyltransferase n=1 Tax=Solirubrobacter ginsenosidimutans TaxID=490573 RepID=A0A9X3MQS0_9ACTN|nr:HemK/PrmC family methyltransferase [Solirubrobacter ginsenosidimutans]MDA0161226.1 peptide chain release factor N(5)-glutamine methyltransferase [Solirubrobacter ginsenosidimutans]
MNLDELTERLMNGGFVAADEEAAELMEAAGGDAAVLEELVVRRETGEPLAWITGNVAFCGLTILVHSDVYVPRWHTELVAERAAARLPDGGVAIDVCTGSGAVAATLLARRPGARVIGVDLDHNAVVNARANGVEAYAGDLFAPLPGDLGLADVIVGVVPYVPRRALPLLQRDTFRFETALAYDGGEEGLDILVRVLEEAPRYLKPGGALVLEVGGAQVGDLDADIARLPYTDVTEITDEDGDLRGIELTYG